MDTLVWSLYIKGLSIFLGVMYLLVGALIVMSILQYGLGLAWRFSLDRLLLDVYSLREFSQRNAMFRDLADAGSVPLMEGPWLKIFNSTIVYFGHFLPGQL